MKRLLLTLIACLSVAAVQAETKLYRLSEFGKVDSLSGAREAVKKSGRFDHKRRNSAR